MGSDRRPQHHFFKERRKLKGVIHASVPAPLARALVDWGIVFPYREDDKAVVHFTGVYNSPDYEATVTVRDTALKQVKVETNNRQRTWRTFNGQCVLWHIREGKWRAVLCGSEIDPELYHAIWHAIHEIAEASDAS